MLTLTKTEKLALDLLPYPLATAAVKTAAQSGGALHEIRLRLGQPLAVTSFGTSLITGIRCTREDIDAVIRRLSGNSLYSHADTIREGYITYADGIRAGLCGRAVTDRGVITAVTDVTSVNIRIPHRVRGAADGAYDVLSQTGFKEGMLVYSPPGVGKTTLLRELAIRLASGDSPHRVALVDTRCELAAGIDECGTLDVLSSYPRSAGIEIAVRTLSPDIVICDEISADGDVSALKYAADSGVTVIASAHADSYERLMSRRGIRELRDYGAIGLFLGLNERTSGGYLSELHTAESDREVLYDI